MPSAFLILFPIPPFTHTPLILSFNFLILPYTDHPLSPGHPSYYVIYPPSQWQPSPLHSPIPTLAIHLSGEQTEEAAWAPSEDGSSHPPSLLPESGQTHSSQPVGAQAGISVQNLGTLSSPQEARGAGP